MVGWLIGGMMGGGRWVGGEEERKKGDRREAGRSMKRPRSSTSTQAFKGPLKKFHRLLGHQVTEPLQHHVCFSLEPLFFTSQT